MNALKKYGFFVINKYYLSHKELNMDHIIFISVIKNRMRILFILDLEPYLLYMQLCRFFNHSIG